MQNVTQVVIIEICHDHTPDLKSLYLLLKSFSISIYIQSQTSSQRPYDN